jgi:Spy/CpxP family protein refolding chaperone
MKKILILVVAIGIIATAAAAYAFGPYGGRGMGPGVCPRVAGNCFWADTATSDEEVQKILTETYELRKQLHDKRFEYFEALRAPGADAEKIVRLEREIAELRDKIIQKNPRAALTPRGALRGYGAGMGRGPGMGRGACPLWK